jgi:hypothetical protein
MTKAIKLPNDWLSYECSESPPLYANSIELIQKKETDDGYIVEITGNKQNVDYGMSIVDNYESREVKTIEQQQELFEQVIRAVYEAMMNEVEPHDPK